MANPSFPGLKRGKEMEKRMWEILSEDEEREKEWRVFKSSTQVVQLHYHNHVHVYMIVIMYAMWMTSRRRDVCEEFILECDDGAITFGHTWQTCASSHPELRS